MQAMIDAKRVHEYYFMIKFINVYVPWFEQGTQIKKLYQKLATLHNLTWRTVARDIGYAYLLKTVFVPVYRHLEAGNITLSLAHVFPQYSTGIEDPDAVAAFTRQLLPIALSRGMTPRKLAMRAREIAETLHPIPLEERSRDRFEALTWRGVELTDREDGLVELRLILSAVAGYAARDRIRRIAAAKHAAHRAKTDKKCLPQASLEHVTAGELLTGALEEEHRGIRANVNVTVPLLSLERNRSRHSLKELQNRVGEIAGLSGNAHLAGYGPVPVTDVASICGVQREWYRMFINPDTGVVERTDTRRPSAALRRLLEVRDPTCRWPGCVVRAEHCDADHTVPWSVGGPTKKDNMELLCRRDHVLKHHAGIKVKQLGGGVLEWTLADGTVFIDEPTPVLPQPPMKATGEGVLLPETRARGKPPLPVDPPF